MSDWSKEEVQAIVRDYFEMLSAELRGEKYVKAHHRRELQKTLNGRSDGAIERKHQNISAVMSKLARPYIEGYKPLGSYQALLEEMVIEELRYTSIDRTYPLTFRSWTMTSPTQATKQMDKSSFLHSGTGVPKECSFFFDFDSTMETREITFVHRGVNYSATLTPDIENTRIRLFWRSSFARIIAETFPSFFDSFTHNTPVIEPPHLNLTKVAPDVFHVSFVVPNEDESDQDESAKPIRTSSKSEGARKTYNGIRYERNPANRLEAIRIHGARCAVCDMDFGEKYGAWGEGFIEVHHKTPLAISGEDQIVNPAIDLVPVCPNCHRMIHRHGQTLSIEDVKSLLQKSTSMHNESV